MTPPERRLGERKRVFLRGRIVFNNRNSVIDCMVRDLSSTGAQIILEHPVSIPQSFELEIPAKSWWLPCEVKWSRLKMHGVMFTRPLLHQGAPADLPAVRASEEVRAPHPTAPGIVARTHTEGGWLFKITTPGDTLQASIFAVAAADPKEALALLLEHVEVGMGWGFEPIGPLAVGALSRLQLKQGEVLSLSGS